MRVEFAANLDLRRAARPQPFASPAGRRQPAPRARRHRARPKATERELAETTPRVVEVRQVCSQLAGPDALDECPWRCSHAAGSDLRTTLRFSGKERAQRRSRPRIFGTRPTGRTSKGPGDRWCTLTSTAASGSSASLLRDGSPGQPPESITQSQLAELSQLEASSRARRRETWTRQVGARVT